MGKSSTTMDHIRTVDDVRRELSDHALAIMQIEDGHKDLRRTIDRKISAARNAGGLIGRDPKYRGVFDNAQDAAAFGLHVLCSERDPRARAFMESAKRQYGDVFVRDMSSGDDSAGGALVPTQFSDRIKRLLESFGVFFRNAFRMPMESNSLSFLKQTGELTVYCPGESAAPTDSDPAFTRVNLNDKEWCTLTYYPRTLGEDSAVEVGEMVGRSIFYAMALKADHIAFNGDASATYFGIEGIIPKLLRINGVDNGGGLVLGAGNAWSELTLANFEDVQGQVPDYADAEYKWYCSRKFYFTVMRKLAMAAGGTTAAEILNNRDRTFLGDPVEFTQVMPRTEGNSQVCALYGDMRKCATWGDRRSVTVEESRDYKMAERQVTVLGSQRVAISIEDVGDANNAGPMVGLITAAG